MIETIFLGIATHIAIKGGDSFLDRLNLPFMSANVIKEIEDAQNEALDRWSKNQGAKDSKFSEVRQLIVDNYEAFQNDKEIPKELIEYLEIFKQIISTENYQNVYRYLTNQQYESYFKSILKKIDSNNLTSDEFDKLSKKQNTIIAEIKKLQFRGITMYKENAYEDEGFFVGSLSIKDSIDLKRQLRFEKDNSFYEKTNTLRDLILYENLSFIIMKGLPGSGKTFELQKLARELWENDDCDLIPFYRNLRDFTTTHTIDSFFDLERINKYINVVFILDGLDEVKDEDDFISKFKTFLNNKKNLTHRFLISCRSNIIGKHKTDFEAFGIFELEDLTLKQSRRFLNKKTNKNFDLITLYKFIENSSFLNDPYKINLVAKYYRKEGALESNPAKLWNTYFESILEADKLRLRKKQLSHYEIKKDSQAIAFILESTKKMNMSEEDIYSILDRNRPRLQAFINSAIVFCEDEKYAFEHKQLQEYLAALLVTSLNYEKIIRIFKVNGIESIKPSLLNTFTLLLSVLEKDNPKLQKLLKWASEIEPDILFNADSDRFIDFRTSVFQSFFRQNCIESTIWINHLTSVSLNKIAKFADCDDNYDYLMNTAQNDFMHFRIRSSAIDILKGFKPKKKEETKQKLFRLLASNASEGYKNINASVLQLFIRWEFQKKYPDIVKDVIDVFHGDDHTSHTNEILNLILNDIDNLKSYKNFISKEFEYEFENKMRRNDVDTARRNSWHLETILLKTKDDKLFLAYFNRLLVNSRLNNYFSKRFQKQCVERIKTINKTEKGKKELVKFFTNLLVAYNITNRLFYNSIINLIGDLKLNKEIFEKLFRSKYFAVTYRSCARLLANDIEIKNLFRRKVVDLKYLGSELECFRNIINSTGKRKLAVEVEDFLLEKGFTLKEEIKFRKTFDDIKSQYDSKLKKEIITLMDKDKFQKCLESYFRSLKRNQISCKEIFDNDLRTEDINSLSFNFGYTKLEERFIATICQSKGIEVVSFEKCIEILQNQLLYSNYVFDELESFKNDRNFEFNIQLLNNDIQKLIEKTLDKVETDDLIKFDGNGSFSIKSYQTLNAIENIHKYLLHEGLNIEVSDDFIINTLKYFDLKNDDVTTLSFKRYVKLIQDENKVSNAILNNLNKRLVSTIYDKHALYAIERDIKDAYVSIRKSFLEDDNMYRNDHILNAYVKANGDDILFELAEKDIHKRTCWTAIMMLFDRYAEDNGFQQCYDSKFDLCIDKSIDYLKTGETEFLESASNVLFKTNRPEIINFILEDLDYRLDLIFSNGMIKFANYSKLPMKGISCLEDIFNEIYKKRGKRDYDISYLNIFFSSYLANLVKRGMFTEIQTLLLKIKSGVEKEQRDDKLFHINMLLREIKNVHVNELSKGLEKKEALKIVKDLDD